MATTDNNDNNKEISALKAQIEVLSKIIAQMNAEKAEAAQSVVVEQKKSSLDEEVTIVHLVERAPGLVTHIELSNLKIDMSRFGEERTLDKRQAEELAGKYSKLFDKGIICFGAGSENIAKKFALKSINSYDYANKDFLARLGVLNIIELEDLFNRLCEGQQSFVIEYFKRKIIENDPAFKDIHKVEMLNRVSDGAMATTILDMSREADKASKK